jgi:hypothetical protein
MHAASDGCVVEWQWLDPAGTALDDCTRTALNRLRLPRVTGSSIIGLAFVFAESARALCPSFDANNFVSFRQACVS